MIGVRHLLNGGRPPSHPVAQRGAHVLPLARLRVDVTAAAVRLRKAGCRRGGVICRDGYWLIVALFGLLAAGVEAVFPPNAQAGTLERLSGAWDILVTDDLEISEPRLFLPSLEPCTDDWHPLRAEQAVFFTSGSTGEPKRVVRTLSELDREVQQLERTWGQTASEATVYATVPHHHIYGLTFARLWPLAAGRPFAATVYDFWESLLGALEPGAVIITSPAHLTRLGGIEALPPTQQPRLVFTAGAPLPHDAANEALRVFGVLPTEIFGSTETGAIATRQQHAATTPWQALHGIDIAADDEGRLSLRSPWVAGGDWFETTDRISIAPKGHGFHLAGRTDRTVKIEGKRVSLIEIEQRLIALPWIADAVALMLPEESVLAAAAVLTPSGRVELERQGAFRFTRALRRQLAPFLEPVALPRRWRFVAALPTAALGKRSTSEIAAFFSRSS